MIAGKTPDGLLPQERKEFVADFDYEFDEKHKTVSVTERGRRQGRAVPADRPPVPGRERATSSTTCTSR